MLPVVNAIKAGYACFLGIDDHLQLWIVLNVGAHGD
jgi:hypothetical protein